MPVRAAHLTSHVRPTTDIGARPIPAILNSGAGSAARARAALQRDTRFRILELKPVDVADAVRAEAERGAPRLLVCGGDGTLSAAIGAAVGTSLEIAVFPGGTLNHFARDLGVPLHDPATALDIAADGTARAVDLGRVNGHAILNTSSLGDYVKFVRYREHLEHWMSYGLATAAAALGVWRDPRPLVVDLQTADGAHRHFQTPILFVGIHERVLDRAALGIRRAGGARALNIFIVNEHARSRLHALAFRAAARGINALVSEHEIECYLTTAATVIMPRASGRIAIDGELLRVASPLRYDFVQDAVNVVQP